MAKLTLPEISRRLRECYDPAWTYKKWKPSEIVGDIPDIRDIKFERGVDVAVLIAKTKEMYP